jgi:DNA-binding SARP family transcriptional activator/tetratricopeptide (TPR) repeat protein
VTGRLDIGLLGDVEVRASGVPVPIAGAKLKAIVALLALGAPHPVSHERLIDEVWAEDPVVNPANALQAQISTLRRLLGRDAVERRGQAYMLAAGPDDVDAIRLDRLVRAGRDAAAGGDHHAAVQHHQAALQLVRGPPLSGLGDFRFACDAAVALDELVLSSREELMDALLATGAHPQVVTVLTGLVRTHPHRERFQAQLVLALYRSGRQADALRAYQDARTALVEQLGVEPGPELQALEQRVLAQDPSLDLPASVLPPVPTIPDDLVASTPGRLGFVGRELDLRSLLADLEASVTGHGGIVLVGGEPGIGKTRLVEELGTAATARGIPVVWGRCFDGRGAPNFWPWIQVINGLLAAFEPDDLRTALGSSVGEIAQIVPDVKELVADFDPPSPLDPESARFRLCQAIAGFIARLGHIRPVVVVVDDLHWADPPSLQLLTFLASQIADAPVLVIGTYRNIDPALGGALADTLVGLGRNSIVRRVDLSGLDHLGLGQLLTEAGAVPDDDLVATVHRRTEGNPFFATELLRLLPRTGAGSPSLTGAVPAGIKGVIRQRVGRLPEPTASTVAVAATLGQAFDLAVLAATVEADGATLLDHLDPAIEAGIIVDNPGGTTRYRFSHGLVNETIYEDLGAARQTRTHHRIARALATHHGETSGPHLLEMATHWFRAVPAADPGHGIDAALAAADWAQAHVAHNQAEEQLRAALELIAGMSEGHGRSLRELEVQDRLSTLLIAATSYSDPEFGRVCARVRELCEEVGESELQVPALSRLQIHYMMSAKIPGGTTIAKQLLQLGQTGGPSSALVAGHVGLALMLHQQGDQAAARPHFDTAIQLFDAGAGDALSASVTEEPVVVVRLFSAINHWLLGNYQAAQGNVDESFAIATDKGRDTWAMAVSFWGQAMLQTLQRDATPAKRTADEGIPLARAGGYGLAVPYLQVCRGWAVASLGEVDAGTAEILEGADLAMAFGAIYMRPVFMALHAEACMMDNRHDDALTSIAEGLAMCENTGERWYESELHRLRGELLTLTGHSQAEAREELELAMTISTAQGSSALARRAKASLARLGPAT